MGYSTTWAKRMAIDLTIRGELGSRLIDILNEQDEPYMYVYIHSTYMKKDSLQEEGALAISLIKEINLLFLNKNIHHAETSYH